jgi:hypothetical protein
MLPFLFAVVACGGGHASPAPGPVTRASAEAVTTADDPVPPEGDVDGRLTSEKDWTSPSVRQVALKVSGRLPTDRVQRIVRQNLGRVRLCYEEGLRSRPEMEGRIDVVFRIDP